MRAQTRIVVRTLCVFDAFLLVIVGFVSAFYVDGVAGPVFGAACWLAAGGLVGIGRWVDPKPTWGWDAGGGADTPADRADRRP